MKEKMCKDCLEIFPATAEYFYKVTIKKMARSIFGVHAKNALG